MTGKYEVAKVAAIGEYLDKDIRTELLTPGNLPRVTFRCGVSVFVDQSRVDLCCGSKVFVLSELKLSKVRLKDPAEKSS